MKNEVINETEKQFLEETLAFPRVYQAYLDLAESQNSTDRLEQLRRTKLTDILQYAATNVPFYQQFQLNTNDIQEQPYKILQSLPPISKDVIRANYDDHISDNIEPDKCYYTETTGSTGEPFQIVHDKHHEIERTASLLRRLRTWGVPWNCRMLHAAGRSDTWQEEVRPLYGSMRYGRFGVPRSSLDLNREDIRKAAEFQPDVIMSHGTEMLLLAQAFNNAGFALRPKVLMTYGEVLGENTRAYLT
jgi:phenylacetate-coenzyme A ligase PaaK-like adenylate-forming protein